MNDLLIVPGAVISGLCAYIILSTLVVPSRISVPTPIILSLLVFGLTKFYLRNENKDYQAHETLAGSQNTNKNTFRGLLSHADIVFVTVYALLLIIAGLISKADHNLFYDWNQFNFMQLIGLAAAVLLSFFMPGFAVLKIIQITNYSSNRVLIFLLAYIFSVAITGLTGYVMAMSGYGVSETKPILVGIHVVILAILIVPNLIKRILYNGSLHLEHDTTYKSSRVYLGINKIEFLIFVSLFALVVLATYYLYYGVIIGDQWFHHGRSLLFVDGAFKFVVDFFYPFFFHALLFAFFSISGVPSVNAYVSINFLNIMPVIAFYYFFLSWVPTYWKSASLLALAFFMLGSGFGWINIVSLTAGLNHPSQLSSLEILSTGELKTRDDIRQPSNFIDTSAPEPTGPLILIALPAGFILLGLIKEKINNKFKYVLILSAISVLGILSHEEFYLFIIVASILLVTFRIPQRKNSVFIAFFLSILTVILTDTLSPVKYYTFTHIIGVPLIYLCFIFVALMWALYVLRIILNMQLSYLNKMLSKAVASRVFRFSLGLSIIGAVCYFYVFTFIVWGELSVTEVQEQSGPGHLPWYLYPIKLGVPGLLGLAFVLSYFFKRYEKELFVFGIISIVAILAGPYYDEFRFSKYVMTGMAGFASLLVYRIIVSIPNVSVKPLLVGLLIGLVVTCSSLSVVLFMGYTALAIENPRDEFHTHLERRIFPSSRDIQFLNFLHNNLINLKTDYVTIPPDWEGLNSKLEGFVGTSLASLPKFLQSPFTLDSSFLEGFYNLLNYSNSRYIILPKGQSTDLNRPQAVNFALENFQNVFQDPNYTVLSVPSFAPPSSPEASGVAMLYQRDGFWLSSSISHQKILPFNNESYRMGNSRFVKTLSDSENQTDAVTLGDKKRSTFFSKPLQDVNYVESTFRILEEHETRSDHAGVVWQAQNKEYYVSLSDRGLRLSEKSLRTQTESLLAQNSEITKENGKWYMLKIVILRDIIQVYLDDLLRLQVSRNSSENQYMSKVGVRSFHSTAWFKPMKIGSISQTEEQLYQKEIYYHHYYPLSALALSTTAYHTFLETDFSAFSKKNIILTRDPVGNYENIRKYLEFVDAGATLVVINTVDKFDGEFSKLMSIKTGDKFKFDSILKPGTDKQVLNVSGFVSTVESQIPNSTVKSYYLYKDQKVAPFAIEKIYGKHGGRIIFVNSAGYFNAIFDSSHPLFSILASMPSLIDLKTSKYIKDATTLSTVIRGARFIGDLTISGNTAINSSSLLVPDRSFIFYVNNISILNDANIHIGRGLNYASLQKHFMNTQVTDLRVYGRYEVTLNSTGILHLPSSSSQYDYIGVPILTGSDLTLRLSESATAEFVIRNNAENKSQPVIVRGGEIQFHGILLQPLFSKSQNVSPNGFILMKSPQVNSDGKSTFKKFYNPIWPFNKDQEVHLEQKLNLRLHHVDDYREISKNVSRVQYITYVDSIGIDEDTDLGRQKSKLIDVPWQKAMNTTSSIMLIISEILIIAIAIWRLWPRIRVQ
jgi:hypothetical protein